MQRNANVANDEDEFISPERQRTSLFFRLCLLSAGAPWVLLLWFLLLTPPDPSVANMNEITEQGLRPPVIGPCREFTLAMTPSVSGTDNCMEDGYNKMDAESERGMVQHEHAEKNDEAAYLRRSFGSHDANDYEAKSLSLGQLEESGDPFQIAAAKLAMTWFHSQGKTVFKVVSNLEFLRKYQEMDTSQIHFIRLERSSNELHFIFRERSPGAATEGLLLAMVDECRTGGGVGDDFGIVHSSRASECGFRKEWDEIFLLGGISKRAHKGLYQGPSC